MRDIPGVKIADRIQTRLDELGINPNAAAVSVGLPRDAIRDILSGKSKHPRADTLMKVARALQVDPAYLLDPDQPAGGLTPLTEAEVVLPVRFEVAAGSWLAVDELYDQPMGYEVATRFREYDGIPQWLELVRGDSVNRLIPDGGMAHVVDAVAIRYEPRKDDLVVVVRRRAQGAFVERSIKQVDFTTDGRIQLWPRSYNERFKEPLELVDASDTQDDTVVEIAGVVIRAYMPMGAWRK